MLTEQQWKLRLGMYKSGMIEFEDIYGTIVEQCTEASNDAKLPVSSRFFIDERVGCIAVRDKKHPSYDPDYQGLHNDTADVIFYAHGNKNDEGWYVDERFRRKAQQVLEHLQSLENGC